jgi:hypothetical protein
MQPAQRPGIAVEAHVGLHEVGGQPLFGELAGTEGAGEVAPVVAPFLKVDNIGAGKRRLGKMHGWRPFCAGRFYDPPQRIILGLG